MISEKFRSPSPARHTPILQLIRSFLLSVSDSMPPISLWMVLPTADASSRFVFFKSTRNSSPPKRAIKSPSRLACFRLLATFIRTTLPKSFPFSSLILLKSSMSRINRAVVYGAGPVSMYCSVCSWKAPAVSRLVRASKAPLLLPLTFPDVSSSTFCNVASLCFSIRWALSFVRKIPITLAT